MVITAKFGNRGQIGRNGSLLSLKQGMLCSLSRCGSGNLAHGAHTGLQVYGSSWAALCVSRTETFAMHHRATEVYHYLAQSLCGRRPRNLPGKQNMKRAAFLRLAD